MRKVGVNWGVVNYTFQANKYVFYEVEYTLRKASVFTSMATFYANPNDELDPWFEKAAFEGFGFRIWHVMFFCFSGFVTLGRYINYIKFSFKSNVDNKDILLKLQPLLIY